jgi:hypothetical protein
MTAQGVYGQEDREAELELAQKVREVRPEPACPAAENQRTPPWNATRTLPPMTPRGGAQDEPKAHDRREKEEPTGLSEERPAPPGDPEVIGEGGGEEGREGKPGVEGHRRRSLDDVEENVEPASF